MTKRFESLRYSVNELTAVRIKHVIRSIRNERSRQLFLLFFSHVENNADVFLFFIFLRFYRFALTRGSNSAATDSLFFVFILESLFDESLTDESTWIQEKSRVLITK